MTGQSTQFRPADLRFIKAKCSDGLIPFVSAGDILPRCKCMNCGDLKDLEVSFARAVSPDYETFKSPVHWVGAQKYIIVDHAAFPCPACGGDHIERARMFLAACGVPDHELSWNIQYIQGKEGKEIAFSTAGAILSEVPMPTGFYLYYGDYGVGKSGILKAITVAMARAGVPALYVNAAQVLAELRSSYDHGAQYTETELLDRFGNVRFLAIDEVDIVSKTEWSLSQIRLLIDRRYENRPIACTLMGTNTDPDQLWPYLASRCQDGIRVFVGGESLRGQVDETQLSERRDWVS